jgi:hypothetical protein
VRGADPGEFHGREAGGGEGAEADEGENEVRYRRAGLFFLNFLQQSKDLFQRGFDEQRKMKFVKILYNEETE